MARYCTEDSMDLRDAEDWDQILIPGGAEEYSAFARWARSSKAHIGSFLLNTTINIELVGLDVSREFDLERLSVEAIRSWDSPDSAVDVAD